MAPYLKVIDLSGNSLFEHMESLSFLTETLLMSSLEVLNLGEERSCVNTITVPMKPITKVTTTCGFASNRKAQQISDDGCMNTLEAVLLNYRDNRALSKCIHRKSENPILRNMPPTIFNVSNWVLRDFTTSLECEFGFTLPIGENLTEIFIDSSEYGTFYSEKIFNYLDICIIANKLSKVYITNSPRLVHDIGLQYILNTAPIRGLRNLNHINLSGNNLTFWNLKLMLSNTPHLRTLILSNNVISLQQNFNPCSTCNLVEKIDFAKTGINIIDQSTFDLNNCNNLTYLNLADNEVQVINFTLLSTSIHFLNLSMNPVTMITKSFQEETQKHGEMIKATSSKTLQIDLTGVTFWCTCSEIDTLKWLIISQRLFVIDFIGFENYVCRYNNNLVRIASIDLETVGKDCSSMGLILKVTFINFAVVFIILSVFMSYKYRYIIYIKYIRLKMWLHHPNNDVTYDAYVCYCSSDRFWVHSSMLSILEEKYGLKLCIHFRDFIPGKVIADAIVEALEKSKTTIIILSETAFKKPWFEFEVNQSLYLHVKRGKEVILIHLNKLNRSSMSQHDLLLKMYDSGSFLKWPEDSARICNNDDDGYLSKNSGDKESVLPPLNVAQKVNKTDTVKEIYHNLTRQQQAFWAKLANKLY